MNDILHGQTIFISASLPSDHRSPKFTVDREHLGWIEDAIIATARAVFWNGGRLVLAGHPSLVPLVALVAGEYTPVPDPRRPTPIGNHNDGVRKARHPLVDVYQSRVHEGYLEGETSAMCKAGLTKVHWVDSRNNERFDTYKLGEPQCEGSLCAMRERLLTQSQPTAMVGIGGMEGLLEEFDMFSRICGGPVYLYRSTGGAARTLADRKIHELRTEDLIQSGRASQSTFRLDSSHRVPCWARLQRVHIVEFMAGRGDGVPQSEGDWVEDFRAFRNERFAHVEDRKREALNPPYDFLANMVVEQIAGTD